MNAVQTMGVDDAPPVFEWPVLLGLLPGLVSAFAALMALASLEFSRWTGTVPVALLHLQGTLLALTAGALAAGAGRQLRGWEQRAAPRRARDRIRASLWCWVAGLLAVGLAGPLALAAVLGWQVSSAQPVLGCLAVLTASAVAGLCLVQGWQGRLPRGQMVAVAVLLLGLLVVPGAVEVVSGDGLLSALVLGLAGLGFWRAAVAQRALAACAAPMPALRLGAGWRRFWPLNGWERVPEFTPYRTMSGWARRPSAQSAAWSNLVLVPQVILYQRQLHWLDWGQAYEDIFAAAGYGVALLLATAYARGCQIAPALNWRRRLAPGGLTAERWATRMVWGSMLIFCLGFTLTIALSALSLTLTTGHSFSLHRCLTVLGDALLASALMAYVRGREDRGAMEFLRLLAACLAAAAVLAVLPLLGATPRRGPLWLLIELALSLVLGRAAIRVWAKRDLNALARA